MSIEVQTQNTLSDKDGEEAINSSISIAETHSEVGDYVAEEQAYNLKTHLLDKQFEGVRSSAQSAAQHMLAGNRFFYRHLVKLMLFWHSAKDTEYIATLIKSKTGKTYKSKVTHGVNFAPLIDVVWLDIDRKDFPSNKSNRISRALNRLYAIYGEQFNFRPDAEDELVEYMVNNGGVNGLVTYGSKLSELQADNIPDHKADKESIKKAAELAKAAIDKAYRDSLAYFREKEDLPSVEFKSEIPVNEDEVSLVLVSKKDSGTYTLIDIVTDKEPVSRALARSYLGQYAELPQAVRFLVETLATQCCSAEHQGTYVQLLNEVNRTSDAGNKAAFRRLIYRHSQKEFLLSNARSNGGLVTIASPKLTVLEDAVDDVALATMSRRSLETYLVSPKNFRLLKFSSTLGDRAIPKSGNDFTHSLKIEVLTEKSNGSATIVPVYFHREGAQQQPLPQVEVIDSQATPAQWEREVSADWFKRFNSLFTHKWVSSHARHLNRPHQTVLDVQFQHSSLTVNFYNLNNEFDLSATIPITTGSPSHGKRRSFLSKDLAIAMLQIADLPIIGKARLSLHACFLRIDYETEVGKYRVYVPAVNSIGTRLNEGFGLYTMDSVIPQDEVFDSISADEGEL